jgi:Flp pilus assembly protein TadD
LLADILDQQNPNIQAKETITPARRDNPHRYVPLGNSLLRNGDGAGAEAVFRKAIALNPEVAGFHKELAAALELQGRFDEAKSTIEKLVGDHCSDPHLLAHFAHLQLRGGDVGGAEQSLRRAIELNSDIPGLHKELAAVLERQGRFEEARTILERLAAAHPSNPHILAHFAHIQKRDGDLAGAEQFLRKAIEIDPNSPGFSKELVALLDGQARSDDAVAAIQSALARGCANPDILGYFANILLREGELDSAEAAFRQAIELRPATPLLQRGLAAVREKKTGRIDACRHADVEGGVSVASFSP